jgi:F-type H+-transporting ATPase subunit gamma
MATLRAIRRQITSIGKTRQITAAMKTVSAIKVRNAEAALLRMRPYAGLLAEIIARLSACENDDVHPLLADRGDEHALLVVITSDRGMCGPFNANVIRKAQQYQEEHRARFGSYARLICVGKRGYDYFRRRGGFEIVDHHIGFFKSIDYEDARHIGLKVIGNFLSLDVDRVDFLYHHYFSAGKQLVQVRTVLPLRVCDMILPEGLPLENGLLTGAGATEYIYEPDRMGILEEILPLYVNVQVWRILQESISSEHGARMMAMEAATDNCDEMLDNMRLVYNKARQAAITKELTEVVSAAESAR